MSGGLRASARTLSQGGRVVTRSRPYVRCRPKNCGQSVRVVVGDVTDDLPVPAGLAPKHVQPRFLGDDRVSLAFTANTQCPDEAHDRDVAGDNDLFDLRGIVVVLGRVAQRSMQQIADLAIAPLRLSAIVVE